MTLRILCWKAFVLGLILVMGWPGASPGAEGRRLKILFMDQQDVRDVWGRVVFTSNPLQPIAGELGLRTASDAA